MRLQALTLLFLLAACRAPDAPMKTVVLVYTAADAPKVAAILRQAAAYPSLAILDPGPEPAPFTPAFTQRLLWCLRADEIISVSPLSPLTQALRAQGRKIQATIF